MKNHVASIALLLVCLVPAGCIQVDPVSEDDFDVMAEGVPADGFGSDWVRPPRDYRNDDPYERVLSSPTVAGYDELPTEKIASLRRYMTRTELFELLGRPIREDVEARNYDTDNVYNATVYTWRFIDHRHSSLDLVRELEVTMAAVDNERPFSLRPGVRGPNEVVMHWDLF